MLVRQNSVARFVTIAVWTAAVDLVTKQIALASLQDHGVQLADGIRLTLVHNNASAFGLWLGPLTWHINVALTLSAAVLAGVVCRQLASIDRGAPLMLGLIAGAAVGNLASMMGSPLGVVDFIAIGSRTGPRLIFNIADVAAYAGIALSIRTVLTISRTLSEGRTRQVPEILVPISIVREPSSSQPRSPVPEGRPDLRGDVSIRRFGNAQSD